MSGRKKLVSDSVLTERASGGERADNVDLRPVGLKSPQGNLSGDDQ